jgi:hypothetical protein
MTAVNLLLDYEHDACHFITDGAALDAEGKLGGFGQKVMAVPHLNAAVAIRGAVILQALVWSWFCASTFPSYDKMKAGVVEGLRTLAEPNLKLMAERGHNFQFDFICGGRPSSIVRSNQRCSPVGHSSLCDFAAAHLQEIHPSRAMTGDIIAFDDFGLGVVLRERIAVSRPEGLGTLPRDYGKRAFRVP